MIISIYLKANETVICDGCGITLNHEGDKVNIELDGYFEYAIRKCCGSCLEDI